MANTVKARSWERRFTPAFTLNGGPPAITYLVVAAGETILKGDPIVLSSGEAAEGAANSGALYGFAGHDAAATETLMVYVADTNTVFKGQADAKTEDIADGAECDIVGSGTNWLIDIGASVEDVIKVFGHVPDDDQTDNTTPGRLLFQVKRSSFNDLLAAI